MVVDGDLLDLVVPASVAAGAALAVTLAYRLLRYLGRHSRLAKNLVQRAYRPSQLVEALVALWLTLRLAADGDWRSPTLHALLLAVVGAGAWLVAALVNVPTDLALRRFQLATRDPITARRIRTRVKVTHRVTLAVVSMFAVGVRLVTFEDVHHPTALPRVRTEFGGGLVDGAEAPPGWMVPRAPELRNPGHHPPASGRPARDGRQ